jgi:hypothetical protein
VIASPAVLLMERLGLSDDELCAVLDVDPLTVMLGELDHRPELPILLDLTAEAGDAVGDAVLRRWLRASGPSGRPIDLLLRRDFAAVEEALGELVRRGFVLRGGAPRAGGGG